MCYRGCIWLLVYLAEINYDFDAKNVKELTDYILKELKDQTEAFFHLELRIIYQKTKGSKQRHITQYF